MVSLPSNSNNQLLWKPNSPCSRSILTVHDHGPCSRPILMVHAHGPCSRSMLSVFTGLAAPGAPQEHLLLEAHIGFLLPILDVGPTSALQPSTRSILPSGTLASHPPDPVLATCSHFRQKCCFSIAFPSGHLRTPPGKATTRTSILSLSCFAFSPDVWLPVQTRAGTWLMCRLRQAPWACGYVFRTR